MADLAPQADPIVGFLTGPTAVGKSDLALALAERNGWEIVSLDSRQVYRGLEIGTAQPTPEEQRRVRHHLVGCLDPTESCSAGRVRGLFAEVLNDLRARDRRALVVGGTGLYWEAIARGIHPLPPASAEIRARHDAILAREGVQGLRRRLEETDPVSARRLGAGDRQRIGRALEIAELTGRTLSDHWADAAPPPLLGHVPVVCMLRPRALLYARIDARCLRMLEAGLLIEMKRLLAAGCPPEAPGLRTVGYRQLLPHLVSAVPLDTCVQEFQRETRRYAKRQETWFRHRLGPAHQLAVGEAEGHADLLERLATLLAEPGRELDTRAPRA